MSKDAYGNPNTPTTGTDVDTDYGTAVVDRVLRIYPNTTARDSAIASPDEGQAVYITGDDKFQIYDGSAWREYLSVDGGTLTGDLFADPNNYGDHGVRNIIITYYGQTDWNDAGSTPESTSGGNGDLLLFLASGGLNSQLWHKAAGSWSQIKVEALGD